MFEEVGQATFQGPQVLLAQSGLGAAAVVLQGPDGGHNDHCIRGEAGSPALDVQEFFCSQVGAKAGFGNYIVPQLQGGIGGCD